MPPKGTKRFKIGIRKDYFPKEIHPKEFGCGFVEIWTVYAESPSRACQKIWQQHRHRLLGLVMPTVKAISLDYSVGRTTIGRMHPIRVWESNQQGENE